MTGARKAQVLRAFGAAAATYDANAPVQRTAAQRLAARIAGLDLPPRPRILEIGCGTGLLSAALRARIPDGDWLITDLSPAMLEACRRGLGDPADARFQVMDGERPALAPDARFDLICASLAFQWFEDLPGALKRLRGLLRPGGWLAFATLAEDSLKDWRDAHAELGLASGAPPFPSLAALRQMAGPGGRMEDEWLVQDHPDGAAFVRALKGIGAGSATPGRRPLSPGDLRQVLRRFEAKGAAGAYHVAYGIIRGYEPVPRGVFVTGTDTGVGKTVVSAVLARAWDADYWKPVQTGLAEDEGDTAAVARMTGLKPGRLHPPRHAYAAPLSPDAAAAAEGVRIAVEDFSMPVSLRPVVVEGAGGPLVPLNDQALTVDLMARLGLPVVLAVANRLGAINHALAALEAVRARGLEVLGVVLVGPAFAANRQAIETHGRVRVLAELPIAERLDAETISAWAKMIAPLPLGQAADCG